MNEEINIRQIFSGICSLINKEQKFDFVFVLIDIVSVIYFKILSLIYYEAEGYMYVRNF